MSFARYRSGRGFCGSPATSRSITLSSSVPSCEEVYEPLEQADDSAREQRWGLEQAVEGLSEEQRDVIVLRHLVGFTPGEIATRMDRTEASIHGLHHRARKALKRELIESDCAPTPRAVVS